MNTVLYLVRHAEVDNPDDVEYMRLPGFGLSEIGQIQANDLRLYFRNKKISGIYASPLLRTKETARIISDGRFRIGYYQELIEANYKKWQGLKRDLRPKSEINGYNKEPVKYSAILGESLTDIQRRTVSRLFNLIEKHRGQSFIVVSHASPIVTARLFFENKPLEQFSKTLVKFGSVTTITFNSKLQCIRIEYLDKAINRGNR